MLSARNTLVHKSIIGSRVVGRIFEVNEQVWRTIIIPQIMRRAWSTVLHDVCADPDDPWQAGNALPDSRGVTPTIAQ